jgi:hypothetical protein
LPELINIGIVSSYNTLYNTRFVLFNNSNTYSTLANLLEYAIKTLTINKKRDNRLFLRNLDTLAILDIKIARPRTANKSNNKLNKRQTDKKLQDLI